MAFPHPKSRKENYRKEDIPNSRGVIWNLFKRAIYITDYRNTKDDVNPAKNGTFGGFFHLTLFAPSSNASIIQSLSIENLRHTLFNP